jgi:hypothetical protein
MTADRMSRPAFSIWFIDPPDHVALLSTGATYCLVGSSIHQLMFKVLRTLLDRRNDWQHMATSSQSLAKLIVAVIWSFQYTDTRK